jgi:hypothetical protein
MAEESKFAGALARLKKPPKAPKKAKTPEPIISSVKTAPRTSGKRSDPEWGNVTILMRREVKKVARRQLEDEGEGKDLSTLIDELLTEWLAKRRE